MAADSLEPKASSQPLEAPETAGSAGKTYDTFNYPATKENANSLPGANINTAGGRPAQAGIVDALKMIRLSDFREVHKKPCTREGFLTGIGAAFGVGGIRAILGEPAPVFTACSWAVGAFAFGSFAMHEFCQRKRKLEKAGIERVNAALNQKRIDDEKRREEVRKTRRRAKEEADR
ncbi:MAG: hypothetical protein Q9220_007018 [cf. Caloplaca sp. 1 TL-2023]